MQTHRTPPSVIRSAPPSTTAPPAASRGSKSVQQGYQAALAYAQCMRTHGVPAFTDPVIANSHSIELGKGGDPSSPQYKSANAACEHLLPNGGSGPTPIQLRQALAQDIKFAKCMRSHGLPNFPDPKETSGGITFGNGNGPQPGVQKGSPQFRAAQAACRRYCQAGRVPCTLDRRPTDWRIYISKPLRPGQHEQQPAGSD